MVLAFPNAKSVKKFDRKKSLVGPFEQNTLDCSINMRHVLLRDKTLFLLSVNTNKIGGMCGRALNTSKSGTGGPRFKPPRRVVSSDKELYSTLSLFTQVYKWVPATHCCGVTLQWTSIPSRGGVAILLGMLHTNDTGISFGHLDLWLMCALTFCFTNKIDIQTNLY